VEKEHGRPVIREPAPDVVERNDVHVAGSLARCPFCHANLSADENEWVACRGCLARHHLGCWGEVGACSTCGRTDFMSAFTRRQPIPFRRVLVPTVIGALLGATGAGVPFGCLSLVVLDCLLRGSRMSDVPVPVAFLLGAGIFGWAGGWVAYKLTQRSQ
jgi:hypothetical protein